MNRRILYIIAALCALACTKAYELDNEIRELAALSDEYVIGIDGFTCLIPVFSNGKVNVSFLNGDVDWAELEKTSFEGDGSLQVKVKGNKDGVPRMTALLLSLEEKGLKDTVYIKQEGVEQALSCPIYLTGDEGSRPNLSQTADGKAVATLEYVVHLLNIPLDDLGLEVEYLDYKGGWVTDYSFDTDKVQVTLAPNDTEISRRAALTLYYVDGWNRRVEARMYLTQSDRNGSVGMDIRPMEVCLLADEKGFKVDDDYVMEGTVISDCSSRNMELNPLLDYNVLDSLASLRTAYIQTEDGHGFKLVFDDEKDNALTFATKVKLNLYGATLIKETAPDRYTISGLSGNNLVEMSEGSVTPKVKKISELTPDDIYTYVTLTGTEFTFKRGSYLNIAEHASYGFMDGWASLLIDDEGSSIYAPVNVNCAWRRTGEGLPQGSGSTTGIIVSHKMPRIGDAGQYQIRVIDRSGFAQEEQSGWTDHAEWYNSFNEKTNYCDTSKNMATLKYEVKKNDTGLKAIVPSRDIVQSLKAGSKNLANGEYYCENIEDGRGSKTTYDSGEYHVSQTKDANGDLKTGVAWMHKLHGWYIWDAAGNITDYNGFVFTFNNLPEEASDYLFAFDFCFGNLNSLDFAHTHPAHWCLEYKDFGSDEWVLIKKDMKMFYEHDYVHMRPLPWPAGLVSGTYCHTGAETGMGFTQHAYLLPSEARQEEGLMLRLRPYDDRIVRLTIDYLEDSEDAHATRTTDLNNGLRMRFGTIALRYR